MIFRYRVKLKWWIISVYFKPTSFQSFKHAQFILRFSLESKVWEKWLHTHNYKKKTPCFNFRIMKPNFNYSKCLCYVLTCQMAVMAQYITVNGENLEQKK